MAERYEKVALSAFAEQVHSHQSKLVDVYESIKDISYEAGTQSVGIRLLIAAEPIKATFNEIGFTKLCQRLGAPAGWLKSDRCPTDLEQIIVDRLKSDVPEEHLFRLRQEQDTLICRSVLTDKYMTYNHWDMWNDMQQILEMNSMADLKPVVWKPSISDSLDAWLLFDNVSADPSGTNPQSYDGGGYGGLRPAIHFKNSEDGTGSVRLSGGFFRSYCTNGVIFGWKEEQRMRAIHMGQRHEMKAYIWNSLTQALNSATKGVDLYIAATKIQVEQEVEDIVKRWSTKFSLGVETSELWTQALQQARPQTLADYVMATSDFAGNQERRLLTTTMEEMAGAMLQARRL